MDPLWRRSMRVSDVAKDPALLQVPKSDTPVLMAHSKNAAAHALLARFLRANEWISAERQARNTSCLGRCREEALIKSEERRIRVDVVEVNLSRRVSNRQNRDYRTLYENRDCLRGS